MYVEIVVAALVCLLTAVTNYYLQWWLFCRRIGIRGPIPLPFIGNIVPAVNPGLLISDPILFKKYGLVIPIMTGFRKAVLVGDPEFLKQIMVRDFKSFVDRGSPHILPHPLSLNMLELRGSQWKRVRSIVTPTFTSGKLKQIYPLISSVADEVIQRIEKASATKEHIDVRKLFGFFTASTISSMAFGLDISEATAEDRIRMTGYFDEAIGVVNNRNWRTLMLLAMPSLSKSNDGHPNFTIVVPPKVQGLVSVLERVYQERLSGSRRVDFFQLMLDARLKTADGSLSGSESDSSSSASAEKLSKAELFGQAGIFLFAGYETTMSALSWTAYLLAQHLDVQDACVKEIQDIMGNDGQNAKLSSATYEQVGKMDFLEAVLKESMRLYTPLRRFFRECTQDTNIGGMEFRKEDYIVIAAHAIHRNTELWGSDADSFNPYRFMDLPQTDFRFQAFGGGQRSCVGERLALLEAKAVLAAILPRYRFVLGPLSVIPPKLTTYTFISRASHDLLLQVEPRG